MKNGEQDYLRLNGVNMIQDLHSHTYYSFCGGDKPEDIVEAAMAGEAEAVHPAA